VFELELEQELNAMSAGLPKKCCECFAGENVIATLEQVGESPRTDEVESTIWKPNSPTVRISDVDKLWNSRLHQRFERTVLNRTQLNRKEQAKEMTVFTRIKEMCCASSSTLTSRLGRFARPT
jgi:hypothetical protein